MKSSNSSWKDLLAGKISPDLGEEIDIFETQLDRRLQGQVDEKVFAETRLRRGAYGQRYDNGQRHDGVETKTLPFPDGKSSKGPHTHWDAPGMQRIKIPYGGMNPEQLETMAELAEEYSDDIAHITTRQDFQLHFIYLDDTPTIMRRLAASGITTQEACGNSIRNVTGCPFAGVCHDEPFDVSPYAKALTEFLLGHPDCQNFGRKFKPTFSGCHQHSCGLTAMHDIGFTAKVREVDGEEVRGFEVVVGGGLGPVPRQAKVLSEFLDPGEILPITQAVARVFGRLGEKKNRNRARLKFLVEDLGLEEFVRLVEEERKILPDDDRWTSFLKDIEKNQEGPSRPPGKMPSEPSDPRRKAWLRSNVRPQKQEGYSAVTITLPLGDITSNQLRELADICREFTLGTIRTNVEQNFVLRWVSNDDLLTLHDALDKSGLGEPGASNILDIVACPGTDTCKLGISSSRGLAAELRDRLIAKGYELDEAIEGLHIKVSGCFNSCGQHHVADLGFYGVSRRLNGYKVPHFQVILGGQWEENAGSYGLPILAIPSKRIPDAVERITEKYMQGREKGEKFKDFVARIGKVEIKTMLQDLGQIPTHDEDPSYYTDWADAREYSTGDIGIGECAGEVVSSFDFDITAAERIEFEGQVQLEGKNYQEAGEHAYQAMIQAAKALVKVEFHDVTDDKVVDEFKTRFFDTEKIFDPYMGAKFANYLFQAHDKKDQAYEADRARHTIEEAQLFIEAVHACYDRLGAPLA